MTFNGSTITDYQREMKVQKALGELKESLVEQAENFFQTENKITKPKDLGYKQIKNLVDVAAMAGSVLEMKAFIRYQMGKSPRGRSWRGEFSTGTFGEMTINKIEEIVGLANKKAKEKGLSDEKTFSLKVLAYFFGFLAWRVKYVEEVEVEKKRGPSA